MNDRVLAMIGMAARDGRTASGEFAVMSAIRSGKARLLVLACDASEASKKTYISKAAYYRVPVMEYGTKESLGRFCGKEERASVVILDQGLADAIRKRIEESGWR